MDLARLFIKRIAYSQTQEDAFVIILHELQSDLKLPIVIGAFEAQSIALELEKKLIPSRPLTHDLFKTFANAFDIQLKQVIIYKLEEGIFYSYVVCIQSGVERQVEARTSDAIAIALRFNAPIYAEHSILEKAGIYIPLISDNEEEETTSISPSLEHIEEEHVPEANRYSKYSLTELKRMLDDCIDNEDYEIAALVHDEISKRKTVF